jgi:hypothetical protein
MILDTVVLAFSLGLVLLFRVTSQPDRGRADLRLANGSQVLVQPPPPARSGPPGRGRRVGEGPSGGPASESRARWLGLVDHDAPFEADGGRDLHAQKAPLA